MSLVQPGRCRHCGCAGESCTRVDGEKCVLDERALACSGERCQALEARRLARVEAEREQAERAAQRERESRRKARIAMARNGLSPDLIEEILSRRKTGRRKRKAA